jgi:hypothetical protein
LYFLIFVWEPKYGQQQLSRMDGEDLDRPVNSDSIKKYCASQSIK